MNCPKCGKKTINKGVIIGVSAAIALVAIVLGLLLHFNIIGSHNNNKTQADGPLDVEYTFEVDKDSVIMKLGDVEITEAEYEFFYRQSYSTLQNSASLSFRDYMSKKLGDAYSESEDYYNEYYQGFAKENPDTFDYRKPIDLQTTRPVDEETGEKISWSEYIRNDAVNSMVSYRVKFELAQEMGLEITDDVKLQVYNHIEGLRTAVIDGGYANLDEYLKILFGESCDEEFFKNELIREYIATKYDAVVNAKLMAEYSDAEIKAVYDADYKEYDFIDLYVYEVKGDNALAIAQKIASESKSLNEFTDAIAANAGSGANKESYPAVPKYYIDGTYTEEMGEWAFDRQRKQNDVSVFKTANGYSVAFVYVPVYTKEDCVSYREIVFNKADSNGKKLEGEALEAIEGAANDVLKQWKRGGATEDSFIYYAMSESQSSNASSGGLNEGVVGMAMTDNTLKAWLLSKERKAGDVEIVESEDAFRIIYFIQGYGDHWNYSIRSTKAGDAANEKYESARANTYAAEYDAALMREVEEDYIDSLALIYLGIESK